MVLYRCCNLAQFLSLSDVRGIDFFVEKLMNNILNKVLTLVVNDSVCSTRLTYCLSTDSIPKRPRVSTVDYMLCKKQWVFVCVCVCFMNNLYHSESTILVQ